MLGKVLEAMITERLSNLVDEFGLLFTNHFGARKRRSCEQALNIQLILDSQVLPYILKIISRYYIIVDICYILIISSITRSSRI